MKIQVDALDVLCIVRIGLQNGEVDASLALIDEFLKAREEEARGPEKV